MRPQHDMAQAPDYTHNARAPGYTITLDRERTLRYDLNALCAIEDKSGRNMLQEGSWDFASMDTRFCRTLLWAGLIHEDPELTLEQAGALLTPDKMEVIQRAMLEAMKASTPEPKGPPPKGAAGRKRRRPKPG